MLWVALPSVLIVEFHIQHFDEGDLELEFISDDPVQHFSVLLGQVFWDLTNDVRTCVYRPYNNGRLVIPIHGFRRHIEWLTCMYTAAIASILVVATEQQKRGSDGVFWHVVMV